MADVLTREQRSRNMSAIRGKNTKPELIVRRIVHRLGFRFRLHRKDLPGKPDLVFPRLGKAILVHGCFWHMHDCAYGAVRPKSNASFWQQKRESNVERDRRNLVALKASGWDVLTVWECRTRDVSYLEAELRSFLSRAEPQST